VTNARAYSETTEKYQQFKCEKHEGSSRRNKNTQQRINTEAC